MASQTTAFGHLLRRYRRAAELTQESLAERAGISSREVRAMEAGEPHRPRPDTLALLVEALTIPEEEQEAFLAAAGRLGPAITEPAAPTQVQTFLVADIRGYTAFTHAQGDEAAARLTTHFAGLVREVIARWGGELIELRGDEALAGFGSARGALRAAMELHEACARETAQNPSLPLRVGMGLDAGEGVPVEGGYRGGALNLAARLCSLAGPGEAFASEAVIHLARAMKDLTYVDRGEVELKGLADPVRVIQVVREGEVPTDIPRFGLQRAAATLPAQPTRFIGREREVAEVAHLLQQENVRLLTLTGPGGVGKTRLAVEVAGRLAERFPDGITYVSLASLAAPGLVCSTVATASGIKEGGSASLLDTLTQHLQAQQLLLLMDNFEHLLPAAEIVSQLLAACPRLTILVTSRAVLHLAAEHEYPVPPLPAPVLGHLPELAALSDFDAIWLFVDRAQAARPTFHLTNGNAAAIVEICQRLDGLPLAIELAAARTRIFPPQALLARLSSRLGHLTGGARDLPARQQTLRSTLDWSYHLLTLEEQRLFAQLSVFAGGFTLEAAEGVCNPEGHVDLLAGLTSLVEQSLVRQEAEEEPRFQMLETMREYAGEKLVEHDGEVQTRDAHARFYLKLAQSAEPELRGPHQGEWFDRLETGHDNLRAALRWLLDRGQIEEELCLAAALRRFWAMRGYSREALQWLEAGLARDNGVAGTIRARALYGVGDLLAGRGEHQRAIQVLEEALRLARKLGDAEAIARTLRYLGIALLQKGDATQASPCFEESLGYFRELKDPWGMGDALHGLVLIAWNRRDFETAEAHCREVLKLAREIGDKGRVATTFNTLGCIRRDQGMYQEASPLLEESLALTRELGRRDLLAGMLDDLGFVVMQQGDLERAAEQFVEGLSLSHDPRNKGEMLHLLEHIAELAVLQGRASPAAQLAGAAAAGREARASHIDPVEQEHRERVLSRVRLELGEDAFRLAWEEGRSMSLEEAVAYALGQSR